MRTKAQAQDQSSARPRVAGRFLQFLLLLLSTGLEPGVAMAQVPVQTDYRYDPAGNLKSVTIAPASAPPALTIVRSPRPMRVGEPARVDWVATDAVSLTQSCVPSGGGVAQVLDKPLTGAAAVQVSAAWVAAPPTCTWTATNARGQVASYVEVLSTVAGTPPAPSITGATFSPGTVTAGGNSQLCWNAANVSRTTVNCTPHYDYQYDGTSTGNGVCGPPDRKAVSAGDGVCTITGFNDAGATTVLKVSIKVVAAPVISSASFASSTVTQGSANSLSWTLGGGAVSASVSCSGVASGSGTTSPLTISTTGIGTGTCLIKAVNTLGSVVERAVSYSSVAAPSISGATFSPALVTTGGNSQLCWNAANVSRTTVSCTPHYDYQYDGTSTGNGVCGPPDRKAVSAGDGVCTITGFNEAGASTVVRASIKVVAAPVISSASFSSSTVTQGSANSLSWTLGGGAASASVSCSGVASGSGATSPLTISTTGIGTGTCVIKAVNAAGAVVERAVSYSAVAAPSISGAFFNPASVKSGAASQLCWTASNVKRTVVNCSSQYLYRYDGSATGLVCGPGDTKTTGSGTATCTITGSNDGGTSEQRVSLEVMP